MKLAVALLSLSLASPALAGKAEGVIPEVLMGPKLGIVSFPAPTVGAEAQVAGWLGLSFDYGWFPDIKLKLHDATVGWNLWSVGAKVFPLRGSFLGVLWCARSIRIRAQDPSTGLSGRGRITSHYLAPELGWRFVHGSGFTLGVDLGWQFVTATNRRLDVPAGYDPDTEKDVREWSRRLEHQGIPVLGLLDVGWMF
jgi:hypothetical protein